MLCGLSEESDLCNLRWSSCERVRSCGQREMLSACQAPRTGGCCRCCGRRSLCSPHVPPDKRIGAGTFRHLLQKMHRWRAAARRGLSCHVLRWAVAFGCPPTLAARLVIACPLLSIAARARPALRSPANSRAPSNCQSPTDSLQPCRPSRPPRNRSRAQSRWAAAASVWARWSKAQLLAPELSPRAASPAPPGGPASLFLTRGELGRGQRVVGGRGRDLAAGAVARRRRLPGRGGLTPSALHRCCRHEHCA